MTSPYLSPALTGVGISTSVLLFENRLLWLRRADPSTTLNKVFRIFNG